MHTRNTLWVIAFLFSGGTLHTLAWGEEQVNLTLQEIGSDRSKIREMPTEPGRPPTGSPWGEPGEGVQARVRAPETKRSAGTIPPLFVDVRNKGTRHLRVQR